MARKVSALQTDRSQWQDGAIRSEMQSQRIHVHVGKLRVAAQFEKYAPHDGNDNAELASATFTSFVLLPNVTVRKGVCHNFLPNLRWRKRCPVPKLADTNGRMERFAVKFKAITHKGTWAKSALLRNLKNHTPHHGNSNAKLTYATFASFVLLPTLTACKSDCHNFLPTFRWQTRCPLSKRAGPKWQYGAICSDMKSQHVQEHVGEMWAVAQFEKHASYHWNDNANNRIRNCYQFRFAAKCDSA